MTALDEILRRARKKMRIMTEAEKLTMRENQAQSYVRSLRPCEHGVRDWETCAKCREVAK